ncbi:MAG: hypothetical protein E7591_01485 [Ruminococcaceae bacterium]|nr:hypothetical protein [Oscillospiraceae bacterium]
MKKSTRLISVLLCLALLVPVNVFGYAASVVQNPAVNMPRSTPVIDGMIEDNGNWSEPAYFNDATIGRFWGWNPPTTTAELYFAYDTSGIYFAADITDNDPSNGFVVSSGYDNINPSGNTKPYGFNGDTMTLMLDALGVFERTTTQTTPWYNVSIYGDNSVHVYRSQVNEGDITSSCTASGMISDTGWRFEVKIPWSVISADVTKAGKTASVTNLSKIDSVSRAAVMYMDRYKTANGTTDTWGRFITVCESTYDGTNGCYTNGVVAKAYGLVLNHADVPHRWGEWQTTVDADCLSDGISIRCCSHCSETQTKAIPALGHSAGEAVIIESTCVSNGSLTTYCTRCNAILAQEIYETSGHKMGDWHTVTVATDTENGLMRKECEYCGYYEEKVVPALAVPYVYAEGGYDVFITLADNISAIRYAGGVYTSGSDIKAAPDCVTLNSTIIKNSTSNGIFSRKMADGGIYTFWMKTNDGKEFISTVDISVMTPFVTSNGVTVTVHNLYGVKDFFIAEGDYKTYTEINQNKIVRVTETKIAGSHDYSYIVTNPGIHTVCIRFNDSARANMIVQLDLTVTEPEFTNFGLQIYLSELDDVKVVRTAYGDYNTPGEIKRAPGQRSFSGKSDLKGKSEYMIQYRENGRVSIGIQYNNGYVVMYKYDVAKKEPVFYQLKNTVTIGNLNDLQVIRYAPGSYTTSSEIKNASDCITIKNTDITDGIYKVTLAPGTYTFCVQYKDESYNYYTVTVDEYTAETVDIADTRQLMVDDYVIDTEYSSVSLMLEKAVKREVVFTFNKSYENGGIVFPNIVEMPEGGYRMYYTAFSGRRRVCYIESKDGITWTRPNLRSNTFNGDSYTNIVTSEVVSPSALYVFYDENAKALRGVYGQWADGMFLEYTYNNGDYFEFWPNEAKMMGKPEETGGCYFDTLNTVYYDEVKGKYIAYVRGFHVGDNYNLTREYVEANPDKIIRDIRYAESDDCINWTTPTPLIYDDNSDLQMYANAVIPYYRAPETYIGMPTHFVYDVPNNEKWTDVYFMSSRDGLNWNRSDSPFLAPSEGEMYEYPNGGYPTVGLIETSEKEISFFMDEYDASKKCDVLCRYTVRIDGFMSAQGETLVTKPITFEGNSLEINYQGQMNVTISDMQGNSLSTGYFTGDEITKVLDLDLTTFRGKAVTLTFEMKNGAKLYSFKFNK